MVAIMRSMELDDEEKADVAAPIAISDAPDYPYGLRICLTEAELEKLGLDPADAVIGGIFHLHALARITSVSCNESDGYSSCRVEAQITDMAVESEDEENEEVDAEEVAPPSAAQRRISSLYKG